MEVKKVRINAHWEKAEKNKNVYLRYELTEDEKRVMAEELANDLSRKTELEDELKTVKSQFKHDIDAVNADINKNARKLKAGHEMRNIECEIYYDWGNDKKITVRADTREEVDRQRIPENEKQIEIPDDPDAKPDEVKA